MTSFVLSSPSERYAGWKIVWLLVLRCQFSLFNYSVIKSRWFKTTLIIFCFVLHSSDIINTSCTLTSCPILGFKTQNQSNESELL